MDIDNWIKKTISPLHQTTAISVHRLLSPVYLLVPPPGEPILPSLASFSHKSTEEMWCNHFTAWAAGKLDRPHSLEAMDNMVGWRKVGSLVGRLVLKLEYWFSGWNIGSQIGILILWLVSTHKSLITQVSPATKLIRNCKECRVALMNGKFWEINQRTLHSPPRRQVGHREFFARSKMLNIDFRSEAK